MNLNSFSNQTKKFIFFNIPDTDGIRLFFTIEYYSNDKYTISCYDAKGLEANYLKRGITQVMVLDKLNSLLMPK